MHNNYENKLKNIAKLTLGTLLKVYSGAFRINASLSLLSRLISMPPLRLTSPIVEGKCVFSPSFIGTNGFLWFSVWIEIKTLRGAWVAQSVERPTRLRS